MYGNIHLIYGRLEASDESSEEGKGPFQSYLTSDSECNVYLIWYKS